MRVVIVATTSPIVEFSTVARFCLELWRVSNTRGADKRRARSRCGLSFCARPAGWIAFGRNSAWARPVDRLAALPRHKRAICGRGTDSWGAGLPFPATNLDNQEVSPMSHAKRVSMRKRRGKAMPVLGAAGLLALATSASAEAPVDTSMPNTGVSHQVFLGEEEISDVSLATFYVFDKENAGSFKPGVQLARGGCGGGCGGCGHGCGGGGGCRGCGGCRGFGGGCAGGCGGGCRLGFGGCRGCACGGCGVGWWGVYGVGCAVGVGCCISWGGCNYC